MGSRSVSVKGRQYMGSRCVNVKVRQYRAVGVLLLKVGSI